MEIYRNSVQFKKVVALIVNIVNEKGSKRRFSDLTHMFKTLDVARAI